MPNMSPKKVEMPVQEPEVRIQNFEEVAIGYTPEMAKEEAERCLHCAHKPCVQGCPVNVNIPDFIQQVKEGDLEEAYRIISLTSSLPAVCGRVCPQESQCEKYCVRGIKTEAVAIGRLERFVADTHRKENDAPLERPISNGHKVAVVGAGPAGLTAAGDLAKMGYEVTVFEALHVAGGVLMYGIPEFRLPKEIVQAEIKHLEELGVDIVTNFVVGRSDTIDSLIDDGFEAIFIGSGAGLPNFMNMPGENLKGVYSANEFLTRINLMKAYVPGSPTPIQNPKRTVVVGGGNVAMDAA
ncbi:FAD-dependent oxidoreductase, partial [Dubosiella newyorkensis]